LNNSPKTSNLKLKFRYEIKDEAYHEETPAIGVRSLSLLTSRVFIGVRFLVKSERDLTPIKTRMVKSERDLNTYKNSTGQE